LQHPQRIPQLSRLLPPKVLLKVFFTPKNLTKVGPNVQSNGPSCRGSYAFVCIDMQSPGFSDLPTATPSKFHGNTIKKQDISTAILFLLTEQIGGASFPNKVMLFRGCIERFPNISRHLEAVCVMQFIGPDAGRYRAEFEFQMR
jgi:hypothetical protein